MKRIILFLFVVSLVSCPFTRSAGAEEAIKDIRIDAKSAIIADVGDGMVLFSKNPHLKLPPASLAKLMTSVIVMENLDLDEAIIPNKGIVRIEPTIAGLKPGVSYKVKDLLAAILIKSANDAARALAERVAGSEENFSVLMNKKAMELGMLDTHFVNASGLPVGKNNGQHTTVLDLVKLMRYSLRYPIILKCMSTKEMDIYGSDGKRIHLKTHNSALLRYRKAPWGKTGYTRVARRTFVGVNPSYDPLVVISLLKSDKLWEDIMVLNQNGLELYAERHKDTLIRIYDWIKRCIARVKSFR